MRDMKIMKFVDLQKDREAVYTFPIRFRGTQFQYRTLSETAIE